MFTIDNEEEKKKKEKNKQKILDEIVELYEKKQKKDNNKKDKNNSINLEAGKFTNNWVKNDNADNFLKCMLPTGIVVGTGGVLWISGFLVGEISKAATFLNGVAIPKAVSGVILTSNFWIVAGCIAGLCLVLFGIVSFVSFLIKTNSNSLNKGNKKNRGIFKEREKKINKGKFQKKQNFKKRNTKINNSYNYGASRNIKNANRYNKNNYYYGSNNKQYEKQQNFYNSKTQNNKNINSPPFLNKEKRNNFEIENKNNKKYKNFNDLKNNEYNKQSNNYKGNTLSKFNKKHYYTDTTTQKKTY